MLCSCQDEDDRRHIHLWLSCPRAVTGEASLLLPKHTGTLPVTKLPAPPRLTALPQPLPAQRDELARRPRFGEP